MNVETGRVYQDYSSALATGESPEDIVEVIGTEEQVQRLSDNLKRLEGASSQQAGAGLAEAEPQVSQQPTIGRVVIYRTDGRNGLSYDLPAIVTCTRDTHPGDYPDGSKNPLPVPDEGCVHLTVFTPGGFGSALRGPHGGIVPVEASQDFKDQATFRPGSGTYVEWNVPEWRPQPGDPNHRLTPRSWRWPERP